MTKSTSRDARSLPALYSELALASWETIWRRTAMIWTGSCTDEEYRRMVLEKAEAMQHATTAVLTGGTPRAVLAPFHRQARANAKRLRREV